MTDVVAFSFDRFWGEPPSFCMVERGGVVIMLAEIEDASRVRPNSHGDRGGGAWDAYIWIQNADALHAEFVAKGANIVRGLCDQPYGCRDFHVLDCNGYCVSVTISGEPMSAGTAKSDRPRTDTVRSFAMRMRSPFAGSVRTGITRAERTIVAAA